MAAFFYLAFAAGTLASGRPGLFGVCGNEYKMRSWDRISQATASVYDHEIARLYPQQIEIKIVKGD
jgi:hypothetical protein